MPTRLILASASPRRRELLSLLGLPFRVEPSKIPEAITPGIPVEQAVEELAAGKAWEVFNRHNRTPIVIGADTIVVVNNGELLSKPRDTEDAKRMLATLSGCVHEVLTAVSLIHADLDHKHDNVCDTEVVRTQVKFRVLSQCLIDAYMATEEPLDKAGAYGIQGFASTFVEAIYGDYFNVVGLPLQTVARMLERIGIEWWRGAEALA